jgi:hypothetical protein
VITGKTADTKSNNITLTRQEKKYISQQLDKFCKSYWKENLFPGSRLISEENLWPYFKNVYQEYSENLSNPNNSAIDKSNLLKNYQQPGVFEFSAPIFLRNNSLCLIYLRSLCGNPCGYGELSIYRLENGNWNKWIVVSADNY